jgi:exodeoxyribonuclease VII small subunit
MSEQKTFESVMGELEALVRKMEGHDVPLDEGLKAYGDGMKLVEQARELLKGYEMKVEKIINAGGETEPFDE